MAADSSNDEAEEGDNSKKEPLSPVSSTISDDNNDGKLLILKSVLNLLELAFRKKLSH